MKKEQRKLLATLAMQGNNAYTLKHLSADTLNSLSADTLNSLSADTLNSIKKKTKEWDSIPILDKPYTQLLKEIKSKKRLHDQATFGAIEDFDCEKNVCETPMCTAGHLVNMAGEVGYELKNNYGWEKAAYLIHKKTHPDFPVQNFGSIPQEWAMAYIEEMVELEKEL